MSVQGVKVRTQQFYDLDLKWNGINIGVDEVGFGCIAGPMVVCAVTLNAEHEVFQKFVHDSKTLSQTAREAAYKEMMRLSPDHLLWAAGSASQTEIDVAGIKSAQKRAAAFAVKDLWRQMQATGAPEPNQIIVDGNDDTLLQGATSKVSNMKVVAVPKADRDFLCVGAASIIAKVCRDRLMAQWSVLYPQYLFGKNKGYPTEEHAAALEEYGPCPLHRKIMVKNLLDRRKEKRDETPETSG